MTPNVFQTLGGSDGTQKPPGDGQLRGTAIDSGWFFFYKAYAAPLVGNRTTVCGETDCTASTMSSATGKSIRVRCAL